MGTDQAHSQQVNIVIDKSKRYGPFRELNPGPLAPEARIIPLDQTAMQM